MQDLSTYLLELALVWGRIALVNLLDRVPSCTSSSISSLDLSQDLPMFGSVISQN